MRRSVEIPGLDNPAGDPTEGGAGAGGHNGGGSSHTHLHPRQRSWLFALPPYIRDLDLEREVIVLSNPERRELDLTGHYVVDKARAHRYDFEDGYTLPPLADVHIYCVPAKYPVDEDDAPAHHLLWTNKDGRPRRKEVLNPDGDTVMLMDANDVEVASLEVTDAGAKRLHLPRLELLQTAYAGNVVAALQASRLLLLVMGFCCLLCDGLQAFLGLAAGALLLDLAARLSDGLRRAKGRARVLAVLGDRVETAATLGALIMGNLQANKRFYGPSGVEVVNLAMFLLLADTLAHALEHLVEAAALADRAAAAPFLPRSEALAPWGVGRYRRQATRFVQRHAAARWGVALVTGGAHLALLLFVGALADRQEGHERGWVLQAILSAQAFLARAHVPTHLACMTLVLGCIAYRFLLVWVALMDFLDVKL